MQKDKKYWLNGIIVAFIVEFIALLAFFFLININIGSGQPINPLIEVLLQWHYLIYFVGYFLGNKVCTGISCGSIMFFVLFIVQVLISGSILGYLGWLYGKIKNRNKSI